MTTVPANAVTSPDITNSINQQFFIEPLSTTKSPISYLDHFPDTLYNKGIHTNLVALLYTLLGPAGIGILRQNYLEARLAIENSGLKTTDLDYFYHNIFAFARFATEVYEEDTEGLLTQEQFEKIQESDKSYQNRAKNFLQAARAGGTPLGIKLAAASGLDHAVEVIENYRALYDEHSDDRLDIEYQGVTRSTEEVIILPRQELPTNAVQVLKFAKGLPPLSGGFKLTMPLGIGETTKNVSPQNPPTVELKLTKVKDGKPEVGVSAEEVDQALEALPGVGKNNLRVSGGPLPASPIEIEFVGELADTPVAPLLVTTDSCIDVEGKTVVLEVEQKSSGVAAGGSFTTIPPESWHYAETAINQIKPVTAIMTPGSSPSIIQRQIPSSVASDSTFIEAIRFVTGNRSVAWPEVDSTHWIVAGEEREAPTPSNGSSSHYLNFHNISTIKAYTENALDDVNYKAGTFASDPNEKVGIFSQVQRTLYPFLNTYIDATHRFAPTDAATAVNIPAFVEGAYIEGIYPVDYTKLPGAEPERIPSNLLWASSERSEGIDILEIDLGTVQAVNFIKFEASNKPYSISVAYDLLDSYNATTKASERTFVPVTYLEPALAKSYLTLGLEPQTPNPWRVVQLSFTDSSNQMIFTRFIRIEFEKITKEGSIFTTSTEKIPFSIEVRNLRVGRNIS